MAFAANLFAVDRKPIAPLGHVRIIVRRVAVWLNRIAEYDDQHALCGDKILPRIELRAAGGIERHYRDAGNFLTLYN
jgi:hypothetical protein